MNWLKYSWLTVALCAVIGCGETVTEVPDPFAPQANTSEGLTDVSSDLMALLEGGTLRGACDAYWDAVDAGEATARMELLCGKEMYFYEGFDTLGIPTVLLETMMGLFPELIGVGATAFKMVADPTSSEGYPLGFGPGKDFGEGIDTLAFTCASCHFSQLPDGRYAVGAPNHDYEYGAFNVVLGVLPLTITPLSPEVHPAATTILEPYLSAIDEDPSIATDLLEALIPLATAGANIPQYTLEIQEAYASWKPGTMDFVIPPLPLDDEVHTVSKIMPLWSIANQDDIATYRMESALLAHTGVATSVSNFLKGFVVLGDGDTERWTTERLAPLERYIFSLRAPDNPEPPTPALVTEGAELFVSQGCQGCHGGARGSSQKVYSFEEIGSDSAMMRWLDPDLDGQPCCDVDLLGRDSLTHGLRAPRLVGMWAQGRFMHNGSVDTLEALFCMDVDRPTITESPYSDRGHRFTCDGLSTGDKEALIAFLLAH